MKKHCVIMTDFHTGQDTLGAVVAAHRGVGGTKGAVRCSLRARLRCEITLGGERDGETIEHTVLNECTITKSSQSNLGKLILSIDGEEVTTVQADGLIVATTTGSTAYSLSAGGSIVAPSVSGTLLTPVSPHTLSFRPVIVDGDSTIGVKVPHNTRDEAAFVSFDGKNRTKLERGSKIRISKSSWPLPLVSVQPYDNDWFHSIRDKLNWNQRWAEQDAMEETIPKVDPQRLADSLKDPV